MAGGRMNLTLDSFGFFKNHDDSFASWCWGWHGARLIYERSNGSQQLILNILNKLLGLQKC